MSVSIVVPCYNVAPYVEECLESLVNQSLQDLEIICVNDGSTDATPALLDAWARRDGRIRVIHRENGGQASARNVGMDTAAGEYVGFVDPDDYVEHAMFARLVEESRRHGADVTACGYTSFSDGDGSVLEELSWSPAAGVEKEVQSSMARAGSVWERMDVVTCNKLYRRDFLNRHGLRFETSFRSMEDDVLWLMALAHASCLAVIPDRLYWYRRRRRGSVSQMLEAQERPLLLVAERLLHATEYWKKCGWLESGLERGWVLRALRHYRHSGPSVLVPPPEARFRLPDAGSAGTSPPAGGGTAAACYGVLEKMRLAGIRPGARLGTPGSEALSSGPAAESGAAPAAVE